MYYIGSVDFKNGDFNLRHIEARSLVEAMRLHTQYVKSTYGAVLDQVTHISVCDMRYVERSFNQF